MTQQRNIVVFHPGALGDVLLALPALRALRQSWPHHRLGLVAASAVAMLLKECGAVDAAFAIEGAALSGLMVPPRSQTPLLRWLSDTDVAVCWMADPEHRVEEVLTELGVSCTVIGSPHGRQWFSHHQSDRFLEIIRSITNGAPTEAALSLPDPVVSDARPLLTERGLDPADGFIVIHPGSGSRHKTVSPELLMQVIERCAACGIQTAILAGPADHEQVSALQQCCSRRFPVFEGFDLRKAAGLLRSATLYVGHDSGITHLAAAVRTPTVALFGPTDPSRWSPRGPHVTVLTGVPCGCVEWSLVQQCREKPCLRITADDVMAACVRTLGHHTVIA